MKEWSFKGVTMATELEQLKEDLLALPVQFRASLAQALIASLDEGYDEDAGTLWLEEIKRRDNEIRSGRAMLKPADQVLREARERLRCMK
jgi:hypothetical protein